MSNRFHFSVIQRKGSLQQCLSVAGRARPDDFCIPRHQRLQLVDTFFGCLDWIAVVVRIVRIQQFTVFPDQRHLGCRRTSVDSQIAVPTIGGKLTTGNGSPSVSGAELLIFCVTFK